MQMMRISAAAVALAAAAMIGCSQNSKVSENWKIRGYTYMEEGEFRPLAGNYLVRVRVYSTKADWRIEGSKAERKAVLRLYYRRPGTGEPVEVAFPDGHSVDPGISGLFVAPDGDRIMVPGTAVDSKTQRPSILNLVSGGKVGPVFEARVDGRPMAFYANAAVPLWSPDGRCFAMEAAELAGDGSARWAVFTWRFLPDRIKTFNSYMALGPGAGGAQPSHHLGGWAPTGDKLVVFEGFPQEQYAAGPKDVFHRVLTADFNRPSDRPVKLWVLDLGHGAVVQAAERQGGWLKESKYVQPRGAEYLRYHWAGGELHFDPPGHAVALPKPPARPMPPAKSGG